MKLKVHLKNLIKQSFVLENTIKTYLLLGIFWTFVGLLLSVWAESLLFLPNVSPGLFDYGHLKPVSSLALLYGAFFSFILGLAYHILHNQVKIEGPVALLAFICMKLHHLGLLIGLVAIFFGFNKGREFGEMPWLADDIFISVFLGFPVLVLVGFARASKKLSDCPELLLLLIAVVGGGVSYVIGNFSLPVSLLDSSFLLTGIQDAGLQEIYRSGILYFIIQASLLGVLYYFVPAYYKTKLYSHSIALFVSLALLLLTFLSASVGLVHTSLPAWLQSMGIFCAMALNFAVLAGGLNARYTISRSSKQYHFDAISLMLRVGIFFLIVSAFLRAIFTTRFMQEWFSYTAFHPAANITMNLQSYALVIGLAASIVVLQLSTPKQAYSTRVLAWLASFWVIGVILLFLGNFGAAFMSYFQISALDPETGDLIEKSWEQVFFASSLPASGDVAVRYLLGLRGLTFVGSILMLLGTFVFMLYLMVVRLFGLYSSSVYEIPNLEFTDEEKIPYRL